MRGKWTPNRPQLAVMQCLASYGAFAADGAFVEPSVAGGLSNRSYLDLRKREIIAEQWGGFATWRPFLALTEAGRAALAQARGEQP